MFRAAFRSSLLLLAISHGLTAAEITWYRNFLTQDSDVSAYGEVVEAFAFTGDRGNNALPGTFPLEDPFVVNGTTFTPLNFTQGGFPDHLMGMTYNDGEFGHTELEDGFEALISGLAFESGIGTQFLELTGLEVGQGYQVEFYYYHRGVDRSVTFDDGNGNTTLVLDGPTGGFGSGYFIADSANQEIIATGSTGSQYLNGYQLRKVAERPPIFDPVEPPPVAPPALVGYWNFDNNTQDQSGHGNHGTISGGVTYDTDIPAVLGAGTSANFDGIVDSHVQITHNELMPVTSHPQFTISMWVKGDGTSGDNNDDRVFSEGSSLSNDPLFNLGTKNDGADFTVDFFYRNGGGPGHQFSVGDAFDDEWHHIAWVDDENVGTLYIDGVEDSSFDYTGFPDFEADITSIGSVLRASDCCNFTGNIDDVSLFNFLLTPAEIASLAAGASPLSITIPGTLLGDFNGNGAYDAEDIDLLTTAVNDGMNPSDFDLNNDNLVNDADRVAWVNEFANTYFGDADLNGEFTSSDFVTVFLAGKYETGEKAGWAEGDWDGNTLFESGDFVRAFLDGGYEQGPRPATQSVPEPTSGLLMLISFAVLGLRRFGVR